MKNFPVIVDGKEYWISRSFAVAVSLYTVREDGMYCVLANKRGSGCTSNIGKWGVVSGFVDYDETLKQACIREVHEETGIDISHVDLKMRCIEDDPAEEGQTIIVRFSGFIDPGEARSQKLTNIYAEPDEVAEIKWIPMNELDNYEWTSKNHVDKVRDFCAIEAKCNHYDR